MSWFTTKPAFVVLLPFLSGLILAYFMTWPSFVVFVLMGIVLLCFFLFRSHALLTHWLVLALIFLTGYSRLVYNFNVSDTAQLEQFADLPCTVTLEGRLIKPVQASGAVSSSMLRVDSVWVLDRGRPVDGVCLLKIYEPCDTLTYGTRIVARGQLRLPPDQRNPGEFNYKKYLAAQGVHTIFRVVSASHIVLLNQDEGCPFLARVVYPVRAFMIQNIDNSLSGQPAALLKALLIGVRGDLDTELRDAFANAGVIHVLAVSGLHVGFVLAGLLGFLSLCRIPNPWRILGVICCLIFYAFLTGLKPSVVRAAIMAIVYLGGLLLQRRAHLLNTLSVAALIMLLVSPLDLFEPGFQLSFVAVLGIIFIYERLSQLLSSVTSALRNKGRIFPVYVITLFCVSLAAQVATIPLTIYYFNRFSLISFFANLIVIPAIAGVVALGMIAMLGAVLHAGIGSIYLNAAWLLLHAVIRFIDAVQRIPFAYVIVPTPSLSQIAVYFLCVFLFVSWPKIHVRKIVLFFILAILNIYVWSQWNMDRPLKITFFDVGQGDAALFEFPNGKTMLVDAGDRTDYIDYGERIIYPYLCRNGISRIDHLLVTHAHADHNGGAAFLLEKNCVGRLLKTHLQKGMLLDSLIETTARRQNIPIHYVQCGDTLLIDPEVLLLILHPTPSFIRQAQQNPSQLNDCSIVFKCDYRHNSILMAGDAEISAEQSMLKYGALLNSILLKCAHHGSATSSDSLFRHAVTPKVGIVSVAAFNRFGLPSTVLLQKFAAEGTRILQTSANGAIQAKFYADNRLKID